MTVSDYYNLRSSLYAQNNPNFRANNTGVSIITKPIEKVENVINTTVDTFVKPEKNEEKKKTKKTAIMVGSSVLVLSALVAILNPSFSGKILDKLKTMSSKAKNKANADSTLKGKLSNIWANILSKTTRLFEFTNNYNSAKDQCFKWLCTEEKTYSGIKNHKKIQNILTSIDKGCVSVLRKPYNAITSAFDSISKKTVLHKYKNANNKLDNLEELILSYKSKLPKSEQKKFESIIANIRQQRDYFAPYQTSNRLIEQEKIMGNLETDFITKLKSYGSNYMEGFKTHSGSKIKDNFKNNISFWAQDILMPERNKIEIQGKDAVDKLIGNDKGVKGMYNEVLEILSPHISKEEKNIFEDSLKKASKRLRQANHSECIEYFDKKRDLILGSAPTDILTGIGALGLSGILIGTADNKDERISRAITIAGPAIAGFGTSFALTAMLFSGVKAMILASISGSALSMLGSATDKYLIPKAQPSKIAADTGDKSCLA